MHKYLFVIKAKPHNENQDKIFNILNKNGRINAQNPKNEVFDTKNDVLKMVLDKVSQSWMYSHVKINSNFFFLVKHLCFMVCIIFFSNVMHNWVGIDVDGDELCSLIVAWGMEMMNESRFIFCQVLIIVKKT